MEKEIKSFISFLVCCFVFSPSMVFSNDIRTERYMNAVLSLDPLECKN